MGLIFNINEELASIAVTSTELLSTSKTTVLFLKNEHFLQHYSAIILEINQSYLVIEKAFSPFCRLSTEEVFAAQFDQEFENFKSTYLMEISKPRKYFDNVYEAYVEMQQSKEAKTRFPLIKNNFVRLNELYDKWINNDSYLAMSIDRAIKLENNLLSEIAGLKEKDVEDSFVVFKSAFEDFTDYLQISRNNAEKINQLFGKP